MQELPKLVVACIHFLFGVVVIEAEAAGLLLEIAGNTLGLLAIIGGGALLEE